MVGENFSRTNFSLSEGNCLRMKIDPYVDAKMGEETIPQANKLGNVIRMNPTPSTVYTMQLKYTQHLFSKLHSSILLDALDLCRNNQLANTTEDWNII